MYRRFSISVLIPCYNEEKGIVEVLNGMPEFIDEVIVVDNGSTDRSSVFAEEKGAIVIYEKRRGYGRAYKTGLSNVRGDIIATLDGDGQHPSKSIAPIIDYILDEKFDFISASRFPLKNSGSMSFRNILGNKIQTYTMRILFGCKIMDSQSGMWVFKRSILDYLKLTGNGMSFSEEIKIEAIKHKEVCFGEFHIHCAERFGETKLLPWRDGVKNMLFLFKHWITSIVFSVFSVFSSL